MLFNFPEFSPPINVTPHVPDWGVPAGDANIDTLFARAQPWPSFTGYISIVPGYVGAYVPPPAAPALQQPTVINNPFSGIINGLFKTGS